MSGFLMIGESIVNTDDITGAMYVNGEFTLLFREGARPSGDQFVLNSISLNSWEPKHVHTQIVKAHTKGGATL